MITRRTTALVLFTAAAAATSVSTASAQPTVAPLTEEHCVVETAPPAGGGELQILATSCFDDFDDVLQVLDAPREVLDRVDHPDDLTAADMAALGPEPSASRDGAARTESDATLEEAQALASTFTLGVHYDAAHAAGTSLAVTGSNCSGGYVNLSSAWNNRVSATKNGCPVVVHWDGFNAVGASQQTTAPGGPLTFMDDRASSIQYRT